METERNSAEYSGNLTCEVSMDFLKLFKDMEQLFAPFSQAEKGNLLDAMMAYAFRGEDTEFSGNERFVWPALRRHFDQCAAYTDTRRENGAKGGRPKTKNNQAETSVSENNQGITFGFDEKTIKEKEQEQEQEQEIEKEQEQEQEQESNGVTVKRAQARRFTPPTIEEVRAYCLERRNHIDPQRFINHYSSNGWKVGKNPMKDWKAAVRTWEGNEYTSGEKNGPTDTGVNYGQVLRQREYSPTQWDTMELDIDACDDHGRLPGEPGYGT